MKTLIVLIAAIGICYVGWTLWQWAHYRKPDPVEYFAGWDGYGLETWSARNCPIIRERR